MSESSSQTNTDEATAMTAVAHKEDIMELEPKESWCNRWFPYLKWAPTSPVKLRDAEEAFLSHVSTPSAGRYVDIGTINGDSCRIWTRQFGKHKLAGEGPLPLVMVHGMAAGIAFFCFNFKDLVKDRPVYAIDLPGFARSSRPRFSSDPKEAEKQYIAALDEWRRQQGIDKMCLMGHSFGGYLSASYALTHPERVEHLILADPWGFPEVPTSIERKFNPPWWVKMLLPIFKNLNPLAAFRAAGPFGHGAIKKLRPELVNKFSDLFETEEQTKKVIPDYIYHCNAQSPTGESVFKSLTVNLSWAKYPMFLRLAGLDERIPVTAIYGKDSWMEHFDEEQFRTVRGGGEQTYTKVEMLEHAGHHLYADRFEAFNEVINEACSYSDRRRESLSEQRD